MGAAMINASALQSIIKEHSRKDFCYGEHDCVTFAVRCFEAANNTNCNIPEWANSISSIRKTIRELGKNRFYDAVLAGAENNGLIKNEKPEQIKPYSICMIKIGRKRLLSFFDGYSMLAVAQNGVTKVLDYEFLFSLEREGK
jgi:hypothetical protein